jgi:hypothetical protein
MLFYCSETNTMARWAGVVRLTLWHDGWGYTNVPRNFLPKCVAHFWKALYWQHSLGMCKRGMHIKECFVEHDRCPFLE